MAAVRLAHVAAFVATLLVAAPLVAHWYLSASVDSVSKGVSEPTFADDALDASFGLEFFSSAEMAFLSMGPEASEASSAADLTKRVKELLRMRSSVLLELRALESRRGEMQRQVEAFHRKIEELRANATRQQSLLERARLSVLQAERAQREFEQRNTPEVRSPLPLAGGRDQDDRATVAPGTKNSCRPMETCFDLARCSFLEGLSVFVYDGSRFRERLPSSFVNIVDAPEKACLLFVFVDDKVDVNELSSLSHWGSDGRNHVLIMLSHSSKDLPTAHRAIVASSDFSQSSFRPNFDVVLPSLTPKSSDEDVWQQSASSLLPLHRKYLISFHGACAASKSPVISHISRMLLDIDRDHTDDRALVDLACQPHEDDSDECQLCADDNYRLDVLKQSTFALLPPHLGSDKISSEMFQVRLMEALRSGAIPVVVGRDSQSMPFSEVLNWRLAAVFVPVARLPELHFLLRTFGDRDLFVLKRQGNLVWKHYLSNWQSAVLSLAGVLSDRLLLPAAAAKDSPSPSAFVDAHQPMALDHLPMDMEPEEALGPLEQPRPSPQFRRNYSSLIMDGYNRWNERFDPFVTFPHTPWDPVLPTDAKFFGSPGFRAIGDGVGGSGHEFSQAIGGNVASEQFTIVMLTYEREQVLIEALTRLYGLPYLNKVLVIWNSPNPPSTDLRWPDIGVPILVVRTDKNSLNNRFLPYDAIETEAVLSMDDDAHLRHDEMVFGFRVWRENRDRIVGFPGRFHAWDLDHNSWLYNSNYSCELSMVLTGAAFYHKYYNYLYSHHMPSAIRQMVDEYMNCEDLAMNFLVAHVTRKPPVKVTSRWTFRCPGCPVSLSEDDSHFQERHKCMNFFTKVFGYMPLLNTQFRADSVLFKTRIPPEKQKCFKFI